MTLQLKQKMKNNMALIVTHYFCNYQGLELLLNSNHRGQSRKLKEQIQQLEKNVEIE